MLLLKSFASDRSVDSAPRNEPRVPTSAGQADLHFHCAQGFATRILAYMLDSLVRVSRRDDENHFVRISIPLSGNLPSTPRTHQAQLCCPRRAEEQEQAPMTQAPRNSKPQPEPTHGTRAITGSRSPPYLPEAFSDGSS
jgi:hypothetical protein